MDGGDYIGVRPRDLIALLMEICCTRAHIPVKLLKNTRRDPQLMDLRSTVAVLAKEFFPDVSAQAVEDGMWRGAGIVHYYRTRHADRLRLYSNYAATYSKCRHALIEHLKADAVASPR